MHTYLRSGLIVACLPALLVAQNNEIRILCSNGLKAAAEKLLPEYERTLGKRIKVQYGTSATFKRSIEGGEPFDLAILTPQLIDDLIKEGKIAAGTKVNIATTGVGIAVRAGSPKPDVATLDA